MRKLLTLSFLMIFIASSICVAGAGVEPPANSNYEYWDGIYTVKKFTINASIHIISIDAKGNVKAIFYFAPHPSSRQIVKGSEYKKGFFDRPKGTLSLVPDEWIEHPRGYKQAKFIGVVNYDADPPTYTGNVVRVDDKKILGTFTFYKQNDETLTVK